MLTRVKSGALHRLRSGGGGHRYSVIGRMRDGVTLAQVQAQLTALTACLPQLFRESYRKRFMLETGFTTRATPLERHVLGDVDQTLWILLGAV
ncbi:hypothetical protein HUW63_18985 [Myxococcus sp. AM001]|nr:hypothetical protein [Myxococcus sp. AM001]